MRYLLAAVVLTVVAACNDPPPPPEKTVFGPLLQQRDRAQERADELPQERRENLDRAIDADAP